MKRAKSRKSGKGSRPEKARNISVKLQLEGGHCHELVLREDSPELASLFTALVRRGPERIPSPEGFIQLPTDDGQVAISFHATQLVSVITSPPVVVRTEQAKAPPEQVEPPPRQAEPQVPPVVIETPRYLVIDNFLAVDEHHDMLAYALARQGDFKAGTVTTDDANYRQNLVIMNFHEAAHSRLLCNRLLTWFPQMTQMLGMDLFALESVESQLTASNDGHYFRVHADSGAGDSRTRALSCVYYFYRQPRAFAGGLLRLYDTWRQGGQSRAAASYQEIEPVSNRLVVFRSDTHHELMPIRCPSRRFEDSRFAVTNWLRHADEPNPAATFGWGQLHCGRVPSGFEIERERGT